MTRRRAQREPAAMGRGEELGGRSQDAHPVVPGNQPGPVDAASPDVADPSALLALIDAERTRAARALEPDAALIYALWGVAWLLGFVTLWAGVTGALAIPMVVAAVVFGGLIGGAVVATAVHVIRRTAGVRGASSRAGAMYGWAWTLGFVALSTIMVGAMRSGLPAETLSLLWAVLPSLVVGLLYLAGGALWQDRMQYGLGLWVLVSSAVGSLAGYPGAYLVIALGGGGGFLLGAAAITLRRRTRP